MAKTADRIVIIGGGAAGLMAAVKASQAGAPVTILEHKDRVGKKILMTGNGKCNLTNISDVHQKYYSSNSASLEKIYNALNRFGAADTRKFFQELGLYTKEKRDGGVYPMSEQASAVLDVLRSACAYQGVDVETGCKVVDIMTDKRGGTVQYIQDTIKRTIAFGCLILAPGGKAAPVTGSDGTGYCLAKRLGHSVITPLPALVQLRCEGAYFKSIAGVRAQAGLSLYVEDEIAAYEEGELQLTDYGISGIPVFQFSRIAARAIYEKKKCCVVINFIPSVVSKWAPNAQCSDKIGVQTPDENRCDTEGFDRIWNTKQLAYKTVEEFLSGMVHKKIASLICRMQKIRPQERIAETNREKIAACIQMLSHFAVTIKAANSFENAQVCCGGVPLLEVSEDFQSQKRTSVYLAGELLDCDGICGGYNLQWAWTTGAIAGTAAAKQVLGK